MATNTILQSLNTDADFGGVSTAGTSNRRQVETYFASAAITAGDWLIFDADKTGVNRVLYVKQAAATALGAAVVGVALTSATAADQPVQVVVAGYVENANVATGSTKGLPLAVDATNGRASLADAANCIICGVALEDASSNVADVYVYKRV